MDKLYDDVKDIIFLYLDIDTLRKTRQYQSKYVKKVTETFILKEAILAGNLANVKWILNNELVEKNKDDKLHPFKWVDYDKLYLNRELISLSVRTDHPEITEILYKYGYTVKLHRFGYTHPVEFYDAFDKMYANGYTENPDFQNFK